jgi:hypothetical protein
MPEPQPGRRISEKGVLLSRSASIVLLALNVVGTGAYLLRAYPSWARPEEHGLIPTSGEPFVWFAGILPVVTVFLVLDVSWGALIILRRKSRAGRWWILAAVAWLVAIGIDFAHH